MAEVVGFPPDCLACGLYSGCKTPKMSGSGPLPCDVLIVGEAPGATEDDLGQPFVGRSGRLLDDILDGVDRTRNSVRITNAVRCRPPSNATPTADHIKCCNRFLREEIAACQPKIIITLGATPAQAVLGTKTALAKIRGTVQAWNGVKVVPTYHPAYALRNPTAIETIAMDMALAFSVLHPTGPKLRTYLIKTQDDLNELISRIDNHKGLLAFDIEGNTKNPFRANFRVPCYAIAPSPDVAYCIPADHDQNVWLEEAQYTAPLKAIQANRNIKLVMHNSYYDLCGTYNRFGLLLPNDIEDTILMYALLDENARHDLDAVTALFCPELVGYSTEINQAVRDGLDDFSKLSLPTLWPYNCYDVLATYRAFSRLKPAILEKGLSYVYRQVMISGIQSLKRIGLAGLKMDLNLVRETNKKYAEKLRSLHEQLLGIPAVRQAMDLWAQHRKETSKHKTDFPLSRYVEPFNPGSVEQKRLLLFSVLGAKPLSFTDKTNNPSVDDETIEKYAKKYKACQILRDYTKLKKCYGTYVAPVETKWLYSFDGLSHSSYKLHVARTGRTCVAKGTMIDVVRDISKQPLGVPIEDVRPGDLVYSYADRNELVIKKVLWAGKTGHRRVVRIHWVGSGHHHTGYVETTPDHLFRLRDGGYKRADELVKKDKLCALHRWQKIKARFENTPNNHEVVAVEWVDEEVDVYDIEVADTHNFIANEICVHNSSSAPNHENVPRIDTNPDIKRFFIPEDGYTFVQMDYSQMELRVLACYSKDAELLKCYRENLDVHKLLASYYYKIPVEEITKAQRTAGKSTNFGVIYGQGAPALADDLGISKHEAGGLIDSYFRKFSGVKRWMDETKRFAYKYGYVTSLIGRIRHLPEIINGTDAARSEAERQAVNSPIQGLASDMLLLRLEAIYRLIDNHFPKVTIRAVVHDSALFQVPIGQVEAFVKVAKPVMEDFSMFDWCIIPILTEWETGPNWGELTTIKL